MTAVVLTYARRELLKECLHALRAQTRPADAVLVVDNGSTDGTAEMLPREFPDVEVLRLDPNAGASGGFRAGLLAAASADWIWLLDDDTIVRPDTLERLLAARAEVRPGPTRPSSAVASSGGTEAPSQRTADVARRDPAALVAAAERRMLPLRATSFVSMLVSGDAVRRHGGAGRGVLLPGGRHRLHRRGSCATSGASSSATRSSSTDAGAARSARRDRAGRFYYHARNNLWTLQGESWRRAEKPATAWFLLATCVRFLRRNRFSRESLGALARAARHGRRPAPAS